MARPRATLELSKGERGELQRWPVGARVRRLLRCVPASCWRAPRAWRATLLANGCG